MSPAVDSTRSITELNMGSPLGPSEKTQTDRTTRALDEKRREGNEASHAPCLLLPITNITEDLTKSIRSAGSCMPLPLSNRQNYGTSYTFEMTNPH